MNKQVKVTWITLRTIAHSLMVHARVSEVYIHFVFMYAIDNIFLGLPNKYLRNKNGELSTPFKLATCTKPSVSYARMSFCPGIQWKAIAHVDKKELNMRHQAQMCFCGIIVGIPQHQNGILCKYWLQRRYYLRMMLFLVKGFLLR